MNDKVVYLHRKESDYSVYYVGMGELRRAYTKHSRNKWWKHTFKKYGLIVDIIAENLSIEDAYELEMFLIEEIGRKDKGLGNLVNLDDGGEGATGHIPTENARRKLSERTSKKVINTETLEILSSATELKVKYNIFSNNLRSKSPKYDWMYLDDYNDGKHLTEEWIHRYSVKGSFLKIINTETLEIFYCIQDAAESIGKGNYKPHQSQYNILSQKLKGTKRNTSDFMIFEDYEKGVHLTKEWINRKVKKRSGYKKPEKEIEIYDFKNQVWFTTTPKKFIEKYKQQPYTHVSLCNGRYCRREYKKFKKTNNQWKNILDMDTWIVERFNQSALAKKLNTKSNNISNFFIGKTKVLYGRYRIVK